MQKKKRINLTLHNLQGQFYHDKKIILPLMPSSKILWLKGNFAILHYIMTINRVLRLAAQ
jgi:hypothetical protein